VRLLLDTHIWLWSLVAPEQLTSRVVAALESLDNELWLSPVSTWELLVLIHKRRVTVDGEPVGWIEDVLRTVPLHEAPLTNEIALASRRLRLRHEDPADRFLAATAKVLDLTLVTGDKRLLRSREYATLANMA
jgi:PIN domain nuclease of toxin-antitoxin system